jgi:hypothetical protein
MRTAARRLKLVRWVAEVAGKGAKSQSRFSSLPEVGRRASLQASMATLARCREISAGGRQTVTLELRSIRLEPHTELATQSLRKILHRVLQTLHQNDHNWTTKAGSPAAF